MRVSACEVSEFLALCGSESPWTNQPENVDGIGHGGTEKGERDARSLNRLTSVSLSLCGQS